MGCFGPPNLGEFRVVYANQQVPSGEIGVSVVNAHKHYANNVVVTSKYKIWNFVPKNLFEQFRRIANFYFLCIVVVQFSILDRTPVSPITSLLPLVFVITVTAFKQGYEDWRRHRADKEVNNRPAIVIKQGREKSVYSKHIKVGDIVKVQNNEEIPCDLVVISSCEEEGKAHIMTANLDGETNLKVRSSLLETAQLTTAQDLTNFQGKVECDHPEYDMYKFNGRMILFNESAPTTHALGPSNLLLRGAKLKNTEYCYGLAVYTGRDTKMAQNQKDKTTKFSSVEKKMNSYLLVFLVILLLLAIICTGLKFAWDKKKGDAWYLLKPYDFDVVEVLINLLSFLVLFNYVIPISLYVTVEIQKFSGALFFDWDLELYHESTDEPAKANTSDLNEELGQVEYLFSDKTGTLTENDMQFRQCSIGGVKYIEVNEKLFQDEAANEAGIDHSNVTEEIKEFLLALALCHTVQADEASPTKSEDDQSDGVPLTPTTTKVYTYQASSPDEKALCEAASRYGVIFKGKSSEYMDLEVCGKLERYKILHVLEFDSTRKRMSIILETPRKEILLLCKGAESHVLPRCVSGPSQETLDHIDGYAELGLRTLTVVSRKIPRSLFEVIDIKLVVAQQAITDREEQLQAVFDEVEQDFHLLGATAVEDKLQDGVKQTIEALREAGIKVWVLTGDKEETAVNISHSCGHFKHGMEIMSVTHKKTEEEVNLAFDECMLKLESKHNRSTEFAVVVDGATLAVILSNQSETFLQICKECVAVLCCRMSPLQKAQVVKLVKTSGSAPITLAIGDGANDCSMIQEAHVGCGIMGKEGRQAVRCSDYAFHRFRYLKRVLLVHGHHYYTRLAVVVQYFFYKNVSFVIPQLLFQLMNGFSSMSLYSSAYLTAYNIFFTSMPVLLYGVFEQDLKADSLMASPILYKDMAKNKLLSWKEFAYWMIAGIWHGLVIFLGTKFLYGKSSFDSGMFDYGMFSYGTFVYTLVIIVANLKFALYIHYWTWFVHFFLWGSILLYIIFVLVFCGFVWPWPWIKDAFNVDLDMSLYHVVYHLFDSSAFWLASILIIWLCIMPDITLTVLKKHFMPTPSQTCQDKENRRRSKCRKLRKKRGVMNICQLTESQEHRRELEENLIEPSLYYYAESK
ncbi:phospholipid-transporting ATPase IF-like isoform X1 [Hydractinia symbiolongicarpus]|uniref:phospholipid-transporting ATPase IF-like isoform X1 n=1 Tax=Hydractinia symbiolongicarpus TaxID=13093 RepID=UPI00254FC00E|nr:phospholipid-transporting ATPase IF-like isoform X1 [Hydractinia symbiolongicarpus]